MGRERVVKALSRDIDSALLHTNSLGVGEGIRRLGNVAIDDIRHDSTS